jgi:hypothetical protein
MREDTVEFIFKMRQLLNEMEHESQKEYGYVEPILENIKRLAKNQTT